MVQRKREKHETKMSYPVDQSFYAAKMKHRDQKKLKKKQGYIWLCSFFRAEFNKATQILHFINLKKTPNFGRTVHPLDASYI